MTGISLREFARRDGCSEKLVRRAVASGRLPRLADGTLDPSHVASGWRERNRRLGATEPLMPRVPVAPGAADDAEAIAATLDEFVAAVLRGEFASLAEAERIKQNALALKHVLELQRRVGETIAIADAESFVFDTFRASRDAWLNWPVRVGPLIAADLGVDADKATEILNQHVHDQLRSLGEPDPDFGAPEPSNGGAAR